MNDIIFPVKKIRIKIHGFILFFAMLTSLPLLASDILHIATDRTQQALFLKAEKLTYQANSVKYKKIYNQLHYYPLQPYLDQRRLLNTMRLSHVAEIDSFLTKYAQSPLDWPLRKAWLEFVAKKNKPLLFMKYFKPTANAGLTCQQLTYALESGALKKVIMPKVTELWLVGKSQDKRCDPLFEQWEKAGYRTDELVWQRLTLAADGGKHTLIPYLTKLLPKNQRYLGKLWHKVRRDPSRVSRLNNFPKKSVKESQIYSYGIKRLIWRQPKIAIESYRRAKKVFNFSQEQKKNIINKFAVALASKNHKLARAWLDKLEPGKLNKDMLQWHLTQMLKQRDWQRLIAEVNLLPKKRKTDLKWQYWYARALMATREREQGQQVMLKLAKKRHYYGFLAASYLKKPASLENKPLEIKTEEKYQVLNHPAAKRAFELFSLQRFAQARREWNYWLKQLNNREKLVAARLAYENNWFDRAIFTLSQVGYLDDVSLRFPKAFANKINRYAHKQQIDPAWAFAITRRESSFMTDAHSSAGAKGLMQIMPNTAKSLRSRSISNQYLWDADNNIQLGTRYLRQLLDKNNGNPVLATAAYNAGPYRVKGWLKYTETLPADIWVETIPFKETRNYVKSVLAYQEIYQHHPGKLSRIFDKVINMNIGD